MTYHLVFCIAEEAMPMVYQFMSPETVEEGDVNSFRLVETRVAPVPKDPWSSRTSGDYEGQRFKNKLEKDEPFKSDWIGTSAEECAAWTMETCQVNYLQWDQIVILDTQSARDGTALAKHYVSKLGSEVDELNPDLGTFPEKTETWYDFRMEPRYVDQFFTDLTENFAVNAEPIYFGLKEELTDDHGVFDFEKAKRIALNEEPGYDVQKINLEVLKLDHPDRIS